MRHIHQKDTKGIDYTYIITDMQDLENHPAIINYPELFDIQLGEPPPNAQALDFIMPETKE